MSAAEEDAPRGAGHSLHDLLEQVRNSGQPNILSAWETVLGDQATSVVWTQRHAEVVGLYQTLMQQVLGLPERDRKRPLYYAPTWYKAVVWQTHWQSNQEGPSKIIDDDSLNALWFVGELLVHVRPGTATLPPADAVDRLHQELLAWLDLLGETDDVPRAIREEIAGQVQHVLWLLENINLFGAAPVVRQTREVVGRVTETIATQNPQSSTASKWRTRAGHLLVALGLFNGILATTNQVLDSGEQTYKTISEIVRGGDGHDAGPAAPPALPSGSASVPSEHAADGNG